MPTTSEPSASIVAEFAAELHKRNPYVPITKTQCVPYPAKKKSLHEVRAVIFDVYGTLFNYWKTGFGSEVARKEHLQAAFGKTIDRFGLRKALATMNTEEAPEQTIYDLYNGLITIKHDLAIGKGIQYSEIRIEQVWETIMLMIMRYGYTFEELGLGAMADVSRCMAYYYNFFAVGRGMYPGVAGALKSLNKQNIKLGIVSNAQFYTPIDLSLYLRDQTNNEIVDYRELFDADLVYFSYEYGISKPDQFMFRKLFDAFYELHFLPEQTVFAGNDCLTDIAPAAENRMRTALFCGDCNSAFIDGNGQIIPDIVFNEFADLPDAISFHAEAKQ